MESHHCLSYFNFRRIGRQGLSRELVIAQISRIKPRRIIVAQLKNQLRCINVTVRRLKRGSAWSYLSARLFQLELAYCEEWNWEAGGKEPGKSKWWEKTLF